MITRAHRPFLLSLLYMGVTYGVVAALHAPGWASLGFALVIGLQGI